MADPQITVAVPSYNQGRFVDAALESIFLQDLPVEVFVMDGGSRDDSVDVIRRWDAKLAGWRSHPDRGQAAAINEAIARGSAPYVCWLNSDDLLYPHGLATLLQALLKQPASPFAYGRCWTITAAGAKLAPYITLPFSPRLFANFCFIAQPATLIRRTAWEHAGGLDENMRMAFDYDLWWRLYRAHGRPIYCKTAVAATRMHAATKTANQAELHYRESIAVVGRNWGTVPLKWRVAMPLMKLLRSPKTASHDR